MANSAYENKHSGGSGHSRKGDANLTPAQRAEQERLNREYGDATDEGGWAVADPNDKPWWEM